MGPILGGLTGGALGGVGGGLAAGSGFGGLRAVTPVPNPFSSMVKNVLSDRMAQSPLARATGVFGQGMQAGPTGPTGPTPPTPGKIAEFARSVGAGGPAQGAATQPSGSMGQYRHAIAQIESAGSGDYRALGPMSKGDRAYGKYQVMGANVPSWTKEALGRTMSPREFLADDAAQDAVFDYKFGQSIAKYGSPEQAASVWFTGRPITAASAAARDVTGTSGSKYVQKFNALVRGRGAPSSTAKGPFAGPANRGPFGPSTPASAPATAERLSPMERIQQYAQERPQGQRKPAPELASPEAQPVISANRDSLLASAVQQINSGDTSPLRSMSPSDRLAALRKLVGGNNA